MVFYSRKNNKITRKSSSRSREPLWNGCSGVEWSFPDHFACADKVAIDVSFFFKDLAVYAVDLL